MQVVLVMFRNDGERRSFSVVRNMTVIGRREDCDLRIPVGDVSRKHCRLVRTDDGIRIEDLGSSNGTYVNGERIQESELSPGDTVGVGPVQFIIQIDGVPDEEDMTPPVADIPQPHPGGAPVPAGEPQDELLTEEHALEELPAEEEFQIEDEPAPVEEAPAMELGEPPAEEAVLEEEHPAEAAEAPAESPVPAEDLEEFQLEEAPLEELPLEEAPVADMPVEHTRVEAPAAAPDPLAELDDFELELEPEHASAASEPEHGLDELEIVEEDAEPAVGSPAARHEEHAAEEPTDSLDELEFDESVFEPEKAAPAAPAAEAAKPAKEDPLDLAPAAPAYAPVDMDSTEDVLEELELEEHPASNGQPPEKAAGESSWDFVIEETEASRSHHDFKLDLDSPHEQPHGQA